MTDNDITFIPKSPQERLLKSMVREVGYGGQAGGAKSYGLVLDAVSQLNKSGYNAILFRRTYKRLSEADGLIDLTKKVYKNLGGIYNHSAYTWTFPQYHNNTIRLSHMEHEKNADDFSGSQYAWIGFDELQEFRERMYLFLFSRNRSSNPDIDLYMRSTFNPGGIGHAWIKKRFEPNKEISQHTRYFKRVDGLDTQSTKDDRVALSRLFISSRLEDNPFLYLDGKGDYEKGLHQLDNVDFLRLRHGDWDIKREGLVYFSSAKVNFNLHSSKLDYSKVDGFYHSHDFGSVNRVWLLFAKIEDVYYLIHEELLAQGTTEKRAERIKSVINQHLQPWIAKYQLRDDVDLERAIKLAWRNKVISGYGGSGSEGQQRIDYRSAGLSIRRLSKKLIQNVAAQINYANTMIEEGQVVICSDMLKTIDQLENCIYDDKGDIQDKAIWHFLDALRYLAAGVSRKGWAR